MPGRLPAPVPPVGVGAAPRSGRTGTKCQPLWGWHPGVSTNRSVAPIGLRGAARRAVRIASRRTVEEPEAPGHVALGLRRARAYTSSRTLAFLCPRIVAAVARSIPLATSRLAVIRRRSWGEASAGQAGPPATAALNARSVLRWLSAVPAAVANARSWSAYSGPTGPAGLLPLPVGEEGGQVRPAGDEDDLVPPLRQHAAVVAADRPSANHQHPHPLLLPPPAGPRSTTSRGPPAPWRRAGAYPHRWRRPRVVVAVPARATHAPSGITPLRQTRSRSASFVKLVSRTLGHGRGGGGLVGGFVGRRAEVAERGVAPAPVVEDLDVVEDRLPGRRPVGPRRRGRGGRPAPASAWRRSSPRPRYRSSSPSGSSRAPARTRPAAARRPARCTAWVQGVVATPAA